MGREGKGEGHNCWKQGQTESQRRQHGKGNMTWSHETWRLTSSLTKREDQKVIRTGTRREQTGNGRREEERQGQRPLFPQSAAAQRQSLTKPMGRGGRPSQVNDGDCRGRWQRPSWAWRGKTWAGLAP
eukprot:352987-Chlamydomonas_euryale.AAC.17